MMMKTAGGPALVHPLDFNDRRRPRVSRATLVATGVVIAAHAGLGVALYYQRFEIPAAVSPPERPPLDVTFLRPPPETPRLVKTPPAPNPDVNDTIVRGSIVETLPIPSITDPMGDTTVLNAETVAEVVTPGSTTIEPVVSLAPVIRNATWSRQPSAAQLMEAYPARALDGRVSGSASLNCLVLATGNVTDCVIMRETPGYGFGRAAQSLSRYFRVNPRMVDGAAEGSRVNVNLRFTQPDD